MAIVNSLRAGVDLLSDVGITQNIIQNKIGVTPISTILPGRCS